MAVGSVLFDIISDTYPFVFPVVQLTIEIKAIKKENPIRKLVLEFILG